MLASGGKNEIEKNEGRWIIVVSRRQADSVTGVCNELYGEEYNSCS